MSRESKTHEIFLKYESRLMKKHSKTFIELTPDYDFHN